MRHTYGRCIASARTVTRRSSQGRADTASGAPAVHDTGMACGADCLSCPAALLHLCCATAPSAWAIYNAGSTSQHSKVRQQRPRLPCPPARCIAPSKCAARGAVRHLSTGACDVYHWLDKGRSPGYSGSAYQCQYVGMAIRRLTRLFSRWSRVQMG
jgi:hypothetical protein